MPSATATANITHFGALSGDAGDSGQTVVLTEGGQSWTHQNIQHALDSAGGLNLKGRVGVLIKDRFLSGLTSTAVMRHASCVPINPDSSRREVEACIELLGIRTLIIDESQATDWTTPSLIRVKAEDQTLIWEGSAATDSTRDEALVLMTSGSTGTPKVISLSHANLLHSTQAIIDSLELTTEDRAINLLPMNHIGGLVDLFLVPLISGGSVVFRDNHSPNTILQSLKQDGITWLQAAPAILQNILHAFDGPLEHHLRLIRSVSAPLSAELHREAELQFGVPVIEMYGMSETAGVITSNPPGAGEQKIGSVGVAVNCEVEIRNQDEVWVRSKGLFGGYANEADNVGLRDGDWFFTGDLGRLDEDGHLFLTGRAKDIVNRGGQKISPVEIDRLALAWDEVVDAAAFGFAHPTLGEELGLALVLIEGCTLSDQEIRARLATDVAAYKIPKRFLRLPSLPRNSSGKLQRFQLATIETEAAASTTPLSATGERILKIWREALKDREVGPESDFFDQGGDSLSATFLLSGVEKEFGVSLSGYIFFENPTVAGLAQAVDQRLSGSTEANRERAVDFPSAVGEKIRQFMASWPGQPAFEGSYARVHHPLGPDAPCLFWIGNAVDEVEVMERYTKSKRTLVTFRSLYLIQKKDERDQDLTAAVYGSEIERIQPQGPLILGGFCEGALIMLNVARQLIEKGREVQLIINFDHILHEPAPARLALIYSSRWKWNPVQLHHNIRTGWNKLFGDNYGLLIKEGDHNCSFSEAQQEELNAFLDEQASLPFVRPDQPARRANPKCSLELLSKPPIFWKRGRSHTIHVRVTNRGSDTLRAGDGCALHARWLDYRDIPRPAAPMHAPLPADLAPGESCELEIDLASAKKIRIYQLQLAVIEEGWGWSPSCLEGGLRLWRLIW